MPGPRITSSERKVIEAMWKLGHTQNDIAATTSRHKSTISR